MSKSLNSVQLMGNLVKDPELRTTPNGQSVCSVTLALNSSYKSGEEWKEKTDFIDVTIWGRQGEAVSKYLTKGQQLIVEGRLNQRTWEVDGQKRSKVDVVAKDFVFVSGGRPSQDTATQNKPAQNSNSGDQPIDLNDIPF
jgi:single-strand DNA-binding protein